MDLDLRQLALCRDKVVLGSQGTYRNRSIYARLEEGRTRSCMVYIFYTCRKRFL